MVILISQIRIYKKKSLIFKNFYQQANVCKTNQLD